MLPVNVPEKTVRRLSQYARCLRQASLRGESTVTSRELARNCGVSSSSVRNDLSYYGEFGKQGSGYSVSGLLANIKTILGKINPPGVIVLGAGHIGTALVESGLSDADGYEYQAIFDSNPARVGISIAGIKVQPLSELSAACDENTIAVIAVSPGKGQEALEALAEGGCQAVISFNLEPLNPPEGLSLRYMGVSTELDLLSHSIRSKKARRSHHDRMELSQLTQ